MQFSMTSDYAVRTVLYLAKKEERPCSASEIEMQMGVPSMYLYKVTKKLKDAEMLTTVQGAYGGYKLLQKPSEITPYDILSLTEPTLSVNACLHGGDCSAGRMKKCAVRHVFCELSRQMEETLRETKIDTLLQKEMEGV